MLCGLQLAGPDNQQLAFAGKVADVDQSKVWPAGTCLGIDPATNQPTDIPIDCAKPHAMEVTGAVNLAEKFPGPVPPDGDQDQFVKDACTQMTDAYLAPVALRKTTLTLIYSTISLPSWTAGSQQVSCSIGATLGNGGWSTLLNSAKGPLLINGQPPVAAARHPRGAAGPAADPAAVGGHVVAGVVADRPQRPGQLEQLQQPAPTRATTTCPASSRPARRRPQTQTRAPSDVGRRAPPQGNTFLNGPPPAAGTAGRRRAAAAGRARAAAARRGRSRRAARGSRRAGAPCSGRCPGPPPGQ